MTRAAADESREEIQDLWARLLAAAADPARSRSFRNAFIETIKKMVPLDAAVFQAAHAAGGRVGDDRRNSIAAELHIPRDPIDVSISNLENLGLMTATNPVVSVISAFGREFLRTLKM